MKKSITILSILGILILTAFSVKQYEKYMTYSTITNFLDEKNWSKDTKEIINDYDIKRGAYYQTITFKDEDKNTYEFNVDGNKKVFSHGWDEYGNPLETTEKYITE
ncbi:DUF3139 domain-containing protein [Vagococcus sp. PNs007]|uniref:DUF3139 domain-containing protein n=1 Tax=Vagococcus proximus TaxID=2991417 RepID=A0ABT5X2A4_9ENTE|nr:DUF3139 domain-containing protein [Vagococcus proximus]MDF0480129.1 DUF3139 domain-containing protein [Vagococcus proximus]